MSKPAERPEIVELPADPSAPVPAIQRRAAAQRVREARDRLTSTSGTRPAFDRELLRQYAQTRISASYVVILLVVTTGILFGFWMQTVSAGAWTCGMMCIHAVFFCCSVWLFDANGFRRGLDLRHDVHSRGHHPLLR